jgi:hypothetical protein
VDGLRGVVTGISGRNAACVASKGLCEASPPPTESERKAARARSRHSTTPRGATPNWALRQQEFLDSPCRGRTQFVATRGPRGLAPAGYREMQLSCRFDDALNSQCSAWSRPGFVSFQGGHK